MGKEGPCYHCGVTSTPLWRNGPPDKPVLCNACGSRWRTKGTLANYTPLHMRADADNYEDHRGPRVKSISINKNKDVKVPNKKLNQGNMLPGAVAANCDIRQSKIFDEDMSNKSSSGSVISNSESCAQFGSADASDLTGPTQSLCGAQSVPSKKRTSINRPKRSPFEKLTRDLYTIWQEEQQSSCFSRCSEEQLLFDNEKSMVSVEIGHGSVLIRHPTFIKDDESEASSLSVDNKWSLANKAYSHSPVPHLHKEKKTVGVPHPVFELSKTTCGQHMQQEQPKRDKSLQENAQVLGSHNSPLCTLDLNDVINFKVFMNLLTNEEQRQLHRYLSPLDTAKPPDSIQNMFVSPEFKENILIYQKLLAEGVFDLSSEAKTEESKMLKNLTLSNLSKSKWVEQYNLLKNHTNSSSKSVLVREPDVSTTGHLVGFKRSRDSLGQKTTEMTRVKSPKRIIMKVSPKGKELPDKDTACFSPTSRSLSALPQDGSSLMVDPVHYIIESFDEDLLLNVPTNNSFLQAELLHPTKSSHQLASTSNSSYL